MNLRQVSKYIIIGRSNPLKHSGYYMYHSCNILKLWALHTECVYVFSLLFEQTANIFLNYIQLLLFEMQGLCVFCEVRTETLKNNLHEFQASNL